MKSIPLTKNRVALVDDVDFEALSAHSWHCLVIKPVRPYAARGRGGNYMHREIMGNPDGMCVDHINGNTLDNRRENLRVCTRAENNRNRKIGIKNTSGAKGVHWSKVRKKWLATIGVNSGTLYLGGFDSVEEAKWAYDAAARKHHGEFARTNKDIAMLAAA